MRGAHRLLTVHSFHTLIAIAVVFLFRVNRLAFLAGVFSNTPWTVAAAAALGTGLGVYILGSDAALPEISYDALTSGQFWSELTATRGICSCRFSSETLSSRPLLP